MDQVRKILGWLKEQHFWVLSGLVAVIAVVCWWSAAGTLYNEFVSNKQTIESEFASLDSLQAKPFHPNDEIIQRQLDEAKQQADFVRETWRQLYERQRENVLKWPIPPLSQQFGEHVEDKQFGDEIDRKFLNEYQNYARRYFPELPKIVDARVQPEGAGGAYGGEGPYGARGAFEGGEYGRGGYSMALGDPLAEESEDYICEWVDQNVVREMLRFPQRPSSIKVWVTQEDLWVYETLLNVIANTNEAAGATRMSNAAVRIIYQLQVGKDAGAHSRGQGRVYMVPSAAPAADAMLGGEGGESMPGSPYGERSPYSAMEMYGGDRGSPYGAEGYGPSGSGPMTEAQEREFLTGGRYLDAEGKPIGGPPAMGAEGDAMTDPTAAAAPTDPTAFGVEYKRLPVRMALKMDQRWLSHLISECANQPLAVEVREVRINPTGLAQGGGSAFGGYGGGYPGPGRGGYERGGMGGGYGGMGGASLFPEVQGIQTFSAQPHIIDVEIQGIIYIFNKPNLEVLKVGDEAQPVAAL